MGFPPSKLPSAPQAPPKPVYTLKPLAGEIRIKAGNKEDPGAPDDLMKADLLATPPGTIEEQDAIAKSRRLMARDLRIDAVPGVGTGWGIYQALRTAPQPTAEECERALLGLIDRGGPNAIEMARFFINNTVAGTLRDFPNGHYWSEEVRKDSNFTSEHKKLSDAIVATIKGMANPAQTVVDPARLAMGPGQPPPLSGHPTNIGFSAVSLTAGSVWRYLNKSPLAFGFGSIQGLEIFLSAFTCDQAGKFSGKLRYALYDHFGSDPSDVSLDQGQAGLYTLQRRSALGQDMSRYKPFRSRINIHDMPFEGQL